MAECGSSRATSSTQTRRRLPGWFRLAAIDHARVGARKIWAGTVSVQPNAKTNVHNESNRLASELERAYAKRNLAV